MADDDVSAGLRTLLTLLRGSHSLRMRKTRDM